MMAVFVFLMLSTQAMLKNEFQIHLTAVHEDTRAPG